MSVEIDRGTIEKAYARWAPVYDLVFGAVFERGRMASIKAAEDGVVVEEIERYMEVIA